MELRETIEKRRSIRSYLDKDISNDIIEDLIECARLSQSAKNRQPWFFVVVKGVDKEKIADIMINNVNNLSKDVDESVKKKMGSVINSARVIKEAPILILVYKKSDDSFIVADTLSIGSAIEHICLRATDLGLGSLWIGDTVYTNKEIEEYIGYDNMNLISAISIGYKNEDPIARKRKEINDILVWK